MVKYLSPVGFGATVPATQAPEKVRLSWKYCSTLTRIDSKLEVASWILLRVM